MSEDGDAELPPFQTASFSSNLPNTLDDGGGENADDGGEGTSASVSHITDVIDGVINTPMEISNVNDIQAGPSNYPGVQPQLQQPDQQQQPHPQQQQPPVLINGGAPSIINGVDTNQLVMVLSFLRSTGCKEAEGALAKELNLSITTTENPMDSNGIQILPPPIDFNEIFQEFTKMINLLDSMFENTRAEFSTLLYPIFVHLYSRIVNAGEIDAARQFMSNFSSHIPPAHFYQIDLLKHVIMPVQLNNIDFIQNLSDTQYGVRLSKTCHKQLESFLSKNPNIQEIVRDHIQIDIIDTPNKTVPYLDVFTGGLLGQQVDDKKQKVYYGVTRDDIVIVGDKKKKKDAKDLKKKDVNAPPPDRIPLPYISDKILEERRTAYRESIKKGRITADNAPSVCIYNALNTNGGLSCATISETSAMMALGLNDGRVVLQCLSEDYFKILKPSNQLNINEQDPDDFDTNIYEDIPLEKREKRITLYAHSSAVTSTSFSPDRRVLLTASLDRNVRLWCLEMRRDLVVYRHPSAIHQMKFCNRGLYFATSCLDQTVNVWTTERVHPIRVFSEPFGSILSLDYHPNNNYVIGGSEDRYVRMWDVLSSSCVRTFTGHKSGVRGIKTSPDGRHLISISEDGALCVWDIGQQKLAAVQRCEYAPTKVPIEFTRDGSVFAVGTPHSGITFFSLDSLIAGDPTETRVDPAGFIIHRYLTKKTPIFDIQFLKKNTVMCIGALEQ
jgi:transcription initiation factor TFIID subunit 5